MERPETIRFNAISRPVDATVRPPGSKSLTNRALLLAGMAGGISHLDGVLIADDTRLMTDALRSLGVPIRLDEHTHRAVVTGCGGHWPNGEADLFCGNAGTVLRFLTAACTVSHGDYRLDGVARMRERPIGDLVDLLRDFGARIGYERRDGFPPLTIAASGLRGGSATHSGTVSSQFVSAVLMAGATATNDVMLSFDAPLPSRPYIRMTLQAMSAFGVEAVERDLQRFIVPAPQTYHATNFAVEPDASAASYFFAAAAVTGGRVTVDGLGTESCQGDAAFVDVLERMGCDIERESHRTTVSGPNHGLLRGVDIDLGDMPDTAQTLAVVAAFAKGETRIRNVANLRIKETDRLAALQNELAAIGVDSSIDENSITVRPSRSPRAARIRTYDDHRMAMSFAVAGLKIDGLEIENPRCVAKSYPTFFEDWQALYRDSESSFVV